VKKQIPIGDYLILFFFGTAQLAWSLRGTFMALPDARRAARIAISVYLALMLSGAALLAVVQ
jgi:hypothetical protein